MDSRYLLKTLLQIKNEAHSQEREARRLASEARCELAEHIEVGGEIGYVACGKLAAISESEAVAEAYKDTRIKISALIDELRTEGAREMESLAKFQGNVAHLIDQLITIDDEESTCAFCNADLYENFGMHMDHCPLPGIAQYAGVDLPIPE
jgi:hypothetical protein